MVSSIDEFLYEPGPADVGNHILDIVVTDNVPGNDPDTVTWNIEVIEAGIEVSLKVYLEGPFNGTQMQTTLNAEGLIPMTQPYSDYPWDYLGDEEVLSIPGINVVDWILVELRDATDAPSATSATTIATQAVFVEKDGTVIGINGNDFLEFAVTISNNLFVVIWHRDHLAILSDYPLIGVSGVYSYDFTTSDLQVYGGDDGYKELAPGMWGMVGGDANADGTVDDLDNDFEWEDQVGEYGYKSGDYSLDSQVNNIDKNDIWLPNSGTGTQVSGVNPEGYSSQVPE